MARAHRSRKGGLMEGEGEREGRRERERGRGREGEGSGGAGVGVPLPGAGLAPLPRRARSRRKEGGAGLPPSSPLTPQCLAPSLAVVDGGTRERRLRLCLHLNDPRRLTQRAAARRACARRASAGGPRRGPEGGSERKATSARPRGAGAASRCVKDWLAGNASCAVWPPRSRDQPSPDHSEGARHLSDCLGPP